MRHLISNLIVAVLVAATARSAGARPWPPCHTTMEEARAFLAGKGISYTPDQQDLELDRLDIHDDELEKLCPLVSLTMLGIYNDVIAPPDSLTGATLDRLGTLVNLENLDLDVNRISARELWRLAPLKKLKSLSLYHNPIGSEGLEALLLLPSLEEVYLYKDDLADDDMVQFSALRFHRSLKKLDLSGNRISDAGLRYLEGLNSIETLLLMANQLTTGEGLRYVARMSGLRTLDLSNGRFLGTNQNKIDGKSLCLLASLRFLEALALVGLDLHDADLHHVAAIKGLTQLDLSANPITAAGLQALAPLVHLRVLSIPQSIPLDDPAVTDLKAKIPGLKVLHFQWG